MSSFGVVLDANVLFNASIRDILLRNAASNLYQLNWTEQILEEVRRNLVLKRKATEAGAERLIRKMKEEFPEAMVGVKYKRLIKSMQNDRNDRHVLAAAVASNSQVIVTFNLRHFQAKALEPFNIEAQSSDPFLLHQLYLEQQLIITNILKQASELRKTAMTLEQLLQTLSVHAPNFSAKISEIIISGN